MMRAAETTSAGPTTALPATQGVWHYVRLGASIALLVAVLGFAAVVVVIPRAAGATPLTVLTSSMEPGLPPGTLLVVRPVEPVDVAIGDVITYQIRSGEPDVITHRVVAISQTSTGERAFTLQGDNNNTPDADTVREVQVQGRLWYSVPLVGYLSLWINGEARGVVIPVLAGLLLAFALYMFISGALDSRRKRRGATHSEG